MRRMWPATVGALAILATPAQAQAQLQNDVQRLSRTASGAVPNGASRNPVISQDKRYGRLAAFESDATDIVPGAGTFTNVYVVERAQPYGENGTPWSAGRTVLASVGRGGAPADGPSTLPSLSGTSREAPRCVAFVSAASNLVRRDTNGKPDAFVRDLVTGVTRRVSVSSRGRQSAGTVTEVSVNGLCTRVAFVSDGGDLALTKTRNRSWRSAVTRRSLAGRRQVYVRAIGGTTNTDKAFKGLTFLASATGRVPADADSFDVAFSVDAGAVTFASAAGNLAAADRNGVTDVYQRTIERGYGPLRKGRRTKLLVMATRLVSATPGGAAGDGASHSPATNTSGEVVAFATSAANLIGAASPFQQVVQSDGGQLRLASRTSAGAPGNGPSGDPSVTGGGSWVVFSSAASDVATTGGRGPDSNGAADAMLFMQASGERWLLGENAAGPPTGGARTSPHGNYIVFERGGQVHLLYAGEK